MRAKALKRHLGHEPLRNANHFPENGSCNREHSSKGRQRAFRGEFRRSLTRHQRTSIGLLPGLRPQRHAAWQIFPQPSRRAFTKFIARPVLTVPFSVGKEETDDGKG